MKLRMKKLCATVLSLLMCGVMLSFGVSAETVDEVQQSATETAKATLLSPALSVLAAENEMSVATLCGNDYYFSEDVFARTLNLSRVDAITVVSLPDVTAGELLMGSERVSAGQRIEGDELQLLSFVAADEEVLGAAFIFSPAGGAYEMVCNIHVLDEVNYSPTISLSSSEALSVSTHRDFVGYGNLSAYDPEGDAMVYEIVNAPENGIVVMTDRTCGEYVYLPRAGFVGEDTFCYVARDVYGNYSASAEVHVAVEEPATKIVYADMTGRREYNAALTMTEFGIMQGEQSGEVWKFNPDTEVNRGEFLVMAMQALGVGSVPSVSDTGFYDNALMSEELRGYVAAARELGYIEGTTDENGNLCFAPTATITRAEAAVILDRMVGGGKGAPVAITPVFADGDDIPAWASEAITALSAKGILTSVGGAISPNATVTRADAACMLAAMMRVK